MTTTQRTHVSPDRSVSAVTLPADARALSTLARVDYEDAFRLDAGVDRPAERWVRAMLNDAPLSVRSRLVVGWLALGLDLRGPWAAAPGARLEGATQRSGRCSAQRQTHGSDCAGNCCFDANPAACCSRR